MKYIVYLTKNKKSKINGNERIYIGVHKTENPNIFDGYIGDGVNIRQFCSFKYPKTPFQYAVKKYGVDSFERTVLYVFDTAQEAYQKELEIVDSNFINLSHTYNMYNNHKKILYQFDLNGKLIKKWTDEDYSKFYGYPRIKFNNASKNKYAFLNSYWSSHSVIDVNRYSNKYVFNSVYLYNQDGKLLMEFDNKNECSEYLKISIKEIQEAIKNQTLIYNKYYISNKIVDQFITKPRRMYLHQTFYVYKEGKFLGKYKGKEVMKIINLHSWKKIYNIFHYNHNWYKDFYVSLEEVSNPPLTKLNNIINIDVYDKYGNFIENINSFKLLKEKYEIPSSKLKDIQQGDKYFNDYIFKYNK